MLAQFVEAISLLAVNAGEPRTMRLPGGKRMMLIVAGREIVECDVPPADRNFAANDLESFADLLVVGENPIAFVSPREAGGIVDVTGYLDRTDRREKVCFVLRPSNSLSAVTTLTTFQDQKTVVSLLRDQLFGCCDVTLLKQMRSIDFTRKGDGSSNVQHGSESLGRSVEATVQSRHGELPEAVAFSLPWFCLDEFAEITQSLTFAFDIDVTNQRVRLVPRGDELELAHQRAVKLATSIIGGAIGEDNVVIGTGNDGYTKT